MTIDITTRWGGDMRLDNSRASFLNYFFYITIKNGNMYLNPTTGQWQSSQFKIQIQETQLFIFNGKLSYALPSLRTDSTSIEVAFYEGNLRDSSSFRLLAIMDIQLSGDGMSAAAKYLNEGKNRSEYVLYGNGTDEGDVSMAFNCGGMKNENMILPQVNFIQPRYPYMFRRRRHVSVTFRGSYSEYASFLRYAQRVRWKGTDMRVISVSLSASDGLVTLNLQTTQ
jgi:hypothetical protein